VVQVFLRCLPRSHRIAQGFMDGIRHPYRRQLPAR
jgi:hypothetical protein